MRIPDTQAVIMILIMAGVTYLIRGLPFILFPGSKKTPAYILYLGKVLPFAIIGMLVVYCFKNISVITSPFGIPELIALLLIAGLHVWKRNTLISVGCGTLFYMFLVQVVFK